MKRSHWDKQTNKNTVTEASLIPKVFKADEYLNSGILLADLNLAFMPNHVDDILKWVLPLLKPSQ
jgi:hypothetical protein